MSNWYWPQWDGSFKYKILAYVLNWLSNKIGFRHSNAKKHDDSYTAWGTEKERIEADTGFLRRLLWDSQWRPFARLCAYIYYFLVRAFWSSSFNYKEDQWTKW